ncbi:MAG: SDR family oxidoreductase [Gemmatimonadota bacterium]
MTGLAGRTVFITGASRGIGRAIAIGAARDGARVAIAARTSEPHPRLPGTIHTTAREIGESGGEALPIEMDVRFEDQVDEAIARTVERFGGIDALVNNAGAIRLTGTAETPIRRFDLMMDVNVRATFLCTQRCLPHLRRSSNPHVLVLAPAIDLAPRWLAPHLGYTISKYGMSLCVIGWAEELRGDGIAVNALWPATTIATAALNELKGLVRPEECRRPEIVADAACWILARDSHSLSGRFLLDEEALAEAGITDLDAYALRPGNPLRADLFVEKGGEETPAS